MLWVELDTREVYPKNPESAFSPQPREQLTLVVYVRQKGKGHTMSKPEDIILAFRSGCADGFRFDRDKDLRIKTAFGEKNFGAMNITEQLRDVAVLGLNTPYYRETVELPIRLSDYKNVVDSKAVSVTIGNTQFNLSPDQLTILKAIFDKQIK